MELKRSHFFVLRCGNLYKQVTLPKGTSITLSTLRGEPVFVVSSGRFAGWHFVASNRWACENIGGYDGREESSSGRSTTG